MIAPFRHAALAALAGCALLNASPGVSQEEEGTTPGAIANPGSYQGSMQLQQQEQQQSQQQDQQNQQTLQRLNENYAQSAPNAMGHAAPAVNWWNRPALAPDKNPLLGQWQQVAAKPTSAPVDSLLAGGCQSMFGTGVIAFEPAALLWVAPDGHEELLNNVAYRANGAEVIVLTKDSGAVLEVQAGVGANANTSPMAGVQLWVTADNPANALVAAGIMADADVPLGQFLNEDCRDAAHCQRDWNAMTAKALGSVRTDAAGHARTPSIPSGRYYIVGMAPYQSRALFWNLPVDAHPGSNLVLLSNVNGAILHN